MKDRIIIDILDKLKTIKPSLTYIRIDKFSTILKNMIGRGWKLSRDNSKHNSQFTINSVGNNKKIIVDNEINTKEFTIKYKNIDYTFHTHHDKYSAFYRLYQNRGDDECIFIIVDKVDKICEIHNLSYNSKCTPLAETSDRKGSSLLKIAFKLINTIKDRYKINKIQLTDNSIKNCKGYKIRLNMMLTLLTGTTWYGKYGFYPEDEKIKKNFDNNKKIMEKTLLYNVPKLKKLIIKAYIKSKSNLDLKKIIDDYKYAEKEKYKIKDYLTKFLTQYDITCPLFYNFYDEIFTELKLTDMYGETFIKDI